MNVFAQAGLSDGATVHFGPNLSSAYVPYDGEYFDEAHRGENLGNMISGSVSTLFGDTPEARTLGARIAEHLQRAAALGYSAEDEGRVLAMALAEQYK